MVMNEGKCVIEYIQDEELLKAESEEILSKYDAQSVLLILEEAYQVRIMFVSGLKTVRATEMMGFMLPEFGLVKGNRKKAIGCVSLTILKSKMVDAEKDSVIEYFEAKIAEYQSVTRCVIANEYAKENEESIKKLPIYTKKKNKWAVVKSTDIAQMGETFIIKSLENESGITITVDENTFVMVGCRGEIYEISAEKFARTYALSDEPLNVFEEMLDFIPEVKIVSTGEHIAIDDRAKICYPNASTRIYVEQLDCRTKVFPGDGSGEYFLGREGDYMVIREDDICDIYIIRKDIFEDTYE